jgi:hypothetical protein
VKRLLLIALIAALILSITACDTEEEPIEVEQDMATPVETVSVAPGTEQAQVMDVTLGEITNEPEALYGQLVRVSGSIDETIADRSVTIASSTLLDLDKVLVINVPPDQAHERNVPIEVTGEVRQFSLTGVEQAYDLDLEDGLYTGFEGNPVIVVQSAEALTLEAILGLQEGTLTAIADRPESFYGQQVAIGGAVAEIESERSFTLVSAINPVDGQVLVITRSPDVLDVVLVPGMLVQTRGEVQPFAPTELEEELGVNRADTSLDTYEGQPAILADSVYVMADDRAERLRRARVLRPANLSDERMLVAILETPTVFLDRWVKVVASAVETVGENGFTIKGTSLPTDGELLVINTFEQTITPLEQGDSVLVAGKMLLFSQDSFEETLDIDLSGAEYAAYEGQPAIIAETHRLVPQKTLRTLRESAIELILQIPGQYTGQPVTVSGGVSDTVDQRSFTLSSGGLLDPNEILVVRTSEQAQDVAVAEGDGIRISGELRLFELAEVESGFRLDLDNELYDRYQTDPVILADFVEVLAQE